MDLCVNIIYLDNLHLTQVRDNVSNEEHETDSNRRCDEEGETQLILPVHGNNDGCSKTTNNSERNTQEDVVNNQEIFPSCSDLTDKFANLSVVSREPEENIAQESVIGLVKDNTSGTHRTTNCGKCSAHSCHPHPSSSSHPYPPATPVIGRNYTSNQESCGVMTHKHTVMIDADASPIPVVPSRGVSPLVMRVYVWLYGDREDFMSENSVNRCIKGVSLERYMICS